MPSPFQLLRVWTVLASFKQVWTCFEQCLIKASLMESEGFLHEHSILKRLSYSLKYCCCCCCSSSSSSSSFSSSSREEIGSWFVLCCKFSKNCPVDNPVSWEYQTAHFRWFHFQRQWENGQQYKLSQIPSIAFLFTRSVTIARARNDPRGRGGAE